MGLFTVCSYINIKVVNKYNIFIYKHERYNVIKRKKQLKAASSPNHLNIHNSQENQYFSHLRYYTTL